MQFPKRIAYPTPFTKAFRFELLNLSFRLIAFWDSFKNIVAYTSILSAKLLIVRYQQEGLVVGTFKTSAFRWNIQRKHSIVNKFTQFLLFLDRFGNCRQLHGVGPKYTGFSG